jgi:uncharacterized Ntn-hydrolase superfamily protein
VVLRLTGPDEGREHRQLHVIDAQGRIGQFTGASCIGWFGAVAGKDFSVAGNMLASERVVAETAGAFRASSALPFPERLIAALQAGEAAGGDKRGKQSAALVIYTSEEYPALSLRVDDHPDPLAELERLEAVSRERFIHFAKFLPTHASPAGVFDRDVIEAGIARALAGDDR